MSEGMEVWEGDLPKRGLSLGRGSELELAFQI